MLARSIAIPPIHAPFACGYRRAHTHSRKGPASTSAETTAGHQAAVADVRSSPAFPFFSKRDARFLFTATRPEQYQRLKAPEFTFAGRSNVGKSSLISAVLRSQGLVKTSKKPGHTSALNFFSLESAAYPGQTLTIVDMPGYGFRSRDEWGQFTMEYLSKRKE
ncbi:hypothetical protein LPJ75_004251 [Coemansia sp. RSA 2598]|nr:hypothetical protein LPJ75_004251 [Coemansia sp. RSA 2598]